MNLWEQIHYTDDDFLIFLGDYIDRGDKPLECLDFVMNLVKNHKNVHALMGNHEWFMQNYFKKYTLKGFDAFIDDWMMERNGGSVTLYALKDLYAKNPEKAMMLAVKGMLPHNSLGAQQLKKLRVYAGSEHENAAQKPEAWNF